jgi:hypothetical protein
VARHESIQSGCGERRAGFEAAQFDHAVADVSVLGQMSRSTCFAAAGYHLVERAAMRELRVEFAAEFTRPAGAGVKAIGDGCVDVFHEGLAPGGSENRIRLVCEAESHYSASSV